MPKIRLLLVDDHEIVRAGIRMLFLAESDMEIVGEVGSGQEAIEAVRELTPDVVIMDVAMPGMTGIEATRQIKEASPTTAVLALTMYDGEQYFFEMLAQVIYNQILFRLKCVRSKQKTNLLRRKQNCALSLA